MLHQTIETLLNRLRYDLDEIRLLSGRPCWIYYEYKHYILSLGIAKLESMISPDKSPSQTAIKEMLTEYRKAYYTILNH